MNKYLERLYNGLIKENPTFVLMLGMCPTLAVHHISSERTWNGTFYNSGTYIFKPFDFLIPKSDSKRSAYACIYRHSCIFCNSSTVFNAGLSA